MSDPRRQRDAAIRRAEQAERERDDLRAILGDIDPAYAAAYHDMCDLAIHGISRPDDLGGPITLNTASSHPPKYHPAAYHYRNEERRWQRTRAAKLRALVEAFTDDNQLILEALK